MQNFMWPLIDPAPFLLFYPAIILACLYGDGNFAIILSVISYQYYFVPPMDSFSMQWPQDYARLSLFLVAAFMIRKIIRHQTEDKLKAEAAVERLEESEQNLKLERETREKFVSALAHDLQTPLTAVKLNLEIIKRKPGDPDAAARGLTKGFANISRIEAMIQNLLDANRIKAGEKLHLDFETVKINALIEQIIKDMKAIHGDRFDLKLKEDMDCFWSIDGIRRLMENLCNNAVKYGDKSPITIQTDLLEKGIVISINNKGSLISEEDMTKLFDPYQRSESAIKSPQKGWGIGLTLVKGIAEAHEGNILVKSNPHDGTTFSVYLPKNFSAVD